MDEAAACQNGAPCVVQAGATTFQPFLEHAVPASQSISEEVAPTLVEARLDQALAGLRPSAPPVVNNNNSYIDVHLQPIKVNVLLLGKTGSEKSTSGNSLAGSAERNRVHHFKEGRGLKSTTKEIQVLEYLTQSTRVADVELLCTLIDTPGLMDTKMPPAEIRNCIAQFTLAAPDGLDVFLCVIKWDVMTNENLSVLANLEAWFGKTIWSHTILILSHCALSPEETAEQIDGLDNDEDGRQNKLREVWLKCGKRAVPIENYPQLSSRSNPWMCPELAQSCQLIHEGIAGLQASGRRYTNDSFEKASEVIQSVAQEGREKWDLLKAERQALKDQLLQGSINKANCDTKFQQLDVQEQKFLEEKRKMEIERLRKALERSDFAKDVVTKFGLAVALVAPVIACSTLSLYVVGGAAGYAATALTSAGQAASLAAFPLLRLGFLAGAGATITRWWTVSFSFGGGRRG